MPLPLVFLHDDDVGVPIHHRQAALIDGDRHLLPDGAPIGGDQLIPSHADAGIGGKAVVQALGHAPREGGGRRFSFGGDGDRLGGEAVGEMGVENGGSLAGEQLLAQRLLGLHGLIAELQGETVDLAPAGRAVGAVVHHLFLEEQPRHLVVRLGGKDASGFHGDPTEIHVEGEGVPRAEAGLSLLQGEEGCPAHRQAVEGHRGLGGLAAIAAIAVDRHRGGDALGGVNLHLLHLGAPRARAHADGLRGEDQGVRCRGRSVGGRPVGGRPVGGRPVGGLAAARSQGRREGEALAREGQGPALHRAGADVFRGDAGLDAHLALPVEQMQGMEADGHVQHIPPLGLKGGGGFDDDRAGGCVRLAVGDAVVDPIPGAFFAQAAVDQGLSPQCLHRCDNDGQARLSGGIHALLPGGHVIGADTHDDGVGPVHVAGLHPMEAGVIHRESVAALERDADGVPLLFQGGGPKIHARSADEARHEQVGGVTVQVFGGVDLLDAPAPHDHDAGAHGHGLHLVVGDVDEGGAQPLVQPRDLRPHGRPQLGIQVGEGLVQKKDLGAPHNGPPQGNPLALASRQGAGLALQVFRDAQNLRRLHDLAVDLLLRHAGRPQGKGHVLVNRHVGVQRVVLKDHGNVPLPGLYVVDDLPVDSQLPCGNVLQPRDHPKRRGLSAPRGPHEYNEFPISDLHAKIVDRLRLSLVYLVYMPQR